MSTYLKQFIVLSSRSSCITEKDKERNPADDVSILEKFLVFFFHTYWSIAVPAGTWRAEERNLAHLWVRRKCRQKVTCRFRSGQGGGGRERAWKTKAAAAAVSR